MPFLRAAALVLIVTGLAGCGGPPEAVRAPHRHVDLTVDDFFVAPQRVRVRPGRVTVTAVNRGRTTHALRVTDGRHDLITITTLMPGERGSDEARLRRGTYRVYDAIANHDDLGAYGTLVVR